MKVISRRFFSGDRDVEKLELFGSINFVLWRCESFFGLVENLKYTRNFHIANRFVILADDLDGPKFAEVEVSFLLETCDDVIRIG